MTRSSSTSPIASHDQPSIRLFVASRLKDATSIVLVGPQSHYLGNVMRRGPGDTLRVFNGIDGEYLATIAECKRERCTLRLGQRLRAQSAEPDLWLAFALLKRSPTDLVVQKATELGASVLLPLFTTRTNADRTNLVRLQTIATEAAEQSERLTVPAVQAPRALNAVLAAWPAGRRLAACFERRAAASIVRLEEPGGLLIGPEGGFTDAELDAVEAYPFVVPVTLGPRILRAETAAIVGLALLQAA